MGWQERDYSDDTYGEPVAMSWGLRRPPPATLTLMILHGGALLLMLMLERGDGQAILPLITLVGGAAHPLGILLHPLATTRVLAAVFVVLSLWSLAGRLEPRLGVGRLIGLYLAGNLAAGAVYFGVASGLAPLATAPLDYPVGGLASLCMAAWRSLRNDPVQVFGRVTSVAKVYAVCAAIAIALEIVRSGLGAGAWVLAALAGAAGALPVERWPRWRWSLRRTPRRKARMSVPRARTAAPPVEDIDVDEILAKISRSGIASLTDAERDRLEAARRAKLRQKP